MADLAHSLLRTTTRAFYPTDHTLVIDALILHSTLSDTDLAYTLGMNNNTKALRKLCGRLREDGLLSVQTRSERRTDGTQPYLPYGGNEARKERMTNKDWYYINFHRAIDSIKWRLHRLNRHVEALGAPQTERRDFGCSRCKGEFTTMEVLDRLDPMTGQFLCPKCGNALDEVEESERTSENESMKRLNSQLAPILALMQQIDATTVPENDFQTALSKQKPVLRDAADPGQLRTEVVDLPNKNLQSTKGLEIKPEKIAVQVLGDEEVKMESEAAELARRREKEARQNMLPDWIAKSTVSGDITAVGAKEERLRQERDLHALNGEAEDKKVVKDEGEDVLNEYYAQLAKEKEQEKEQQRVEDEEEDEDDEDDDVDFEDVDGVGTPANGTPSVMVGGVNGGTVASSGVATPNLDSSNATEDERDVKRVKVEAEIETNGKAEDTPAASDEDEELEFQDVA